MINMFIQDSSKQTVGVLVVTGVGYSYQFVYKDLQTKEEFSGELQAQRGAAYLMQTGKVRGMLRGFFDPPEIGSSMAFIKDGSLLTAVVMAPGAQPTSPAQGQAPGQAPGLPSGPTPGPPPRPSSPAPPAPSTSKPPPAAAADPIPVDARIISEIDVQYNGSNCGTIVIMKSGAGDLYFAYKSTQAVLLRQGKLTPAGEDYQAEGLGLLRQWSEDCAPGARVMLITPEPKLFIGTVKGPAQQSNRGRQAALGQQGFGLPGSGPRLPGSIDLNRQQLAELLAGRW